LQLDCDGICVRQCWLVSREQRMVENILFKQDLRPAIRCTVALHYRLDRLWYITREARIEALPCARRFINTNIGTLVGPSGQEPLERWAMSLETG